MFVYSTTETDGRLFSLSIATGMHCLLHAITSDENEHVVF